MKPLTKKDIEFWSTKFDHQKEWIIRRKDVLGAKQWLKKRIGDSGLVNETHYEIFADFIDEAFDIEDDN